MGPGRSLGPNIAPTSHLYIKITCIPPKFTFNTTPTAHDSTNGYQIMPSKIYFPQAFSDLFTYNDSQNKEYRP